jgi:hypothetical protein
MVELSVGFAASAIRYLGTSRTSEAFNLVNTGYRFREDLYLKHFHAFGSKAVERSDKLGLFPSDILCEGLNAELPKPDRSPYLVGRSKLDR